MTDDRPGDRGDDRQERRYRLDEPRNVTRIVYGLYAVCLVLLVVELVIHRKAEFESEAESWFGFYAVLGFVAYTAIVYTAKALRRLVRRSEDYYRDGSDG